MTRLNRRRVSSVASASSGAHNVNGLAIRVHASEATVNAHESYPYLRLASSQTSSAAEKAVNDSSIRLAYASVSASCTKDRAFCSAYVADFGSCRNKSEVISTAR